MELYGFLMEKSVILILRITNFDLENAINYVANSGLVLSFFKKLNVCIDLIETCIER